MKLLLTSAGFSNENIRQTFPNLFSKSVKDAKILFITTAARRKEELQYVYMSKVELVEMGIKKENIIIFDLNNIPTYKQTLEYDAIYVCGGNTFYLASKMKESGFDTILKKVVNEGLVYIGVSAGSIFAGPTVKISRDTNDVGLTDLSGLELTEIVVAVHYDQQEVERQKQIDKLKQDFKVITLTDKQVLTIIDNEEKLIE